MRAEHPDVPAEPAPSPHRPRRARSREVRKWVGIGLLALGGALLLVAHDRREQNAGRGEAATGVIERSESAPRTGGDGGELEVPASAPYALIGGVIALVLGAALLLRSRSIPPETARDERA